MTEAPSENALRRGAWAAARRVLCVRLDSLGDVLMCTPAMRALRNAVPEREITLLTSQAGAALAPYLPEVDHVIQYAAPWMKHGPAQSPETDLAFIDALRRQAFDAAVIFTTFTQSALPAALTCMLAGIPLRLAHSRENPYRLLSDWVPDPEPAQLQRHEVERQLDLVTAVGAGVGTSVGTSLPDTGTARRLSFVVPASARITVDAMLEGIGAAGRKWVLLHPGASAASRRYPEALWSELADRIQTELGWLAVFAGSAEEGTAVQRILEGMQTQARSLAGRLDLGELAALIERAPLMVANNSGPAHVAAALGTPLVSLYALTNLQHQPWQTPSRVLYHDVPCRNCLKSVCPMVHHDCLSKVSPLRALQAVRELMEERIRARHRAGG